MATINFHICIDDNLMKKSDKILSDMGMNMTTAVNVFLHQVVRQRKIPFEISLESQDSDKLEIDDECMDDMFEDDEFIDYYGC